MSGAVAENNMDDIEEKITGLLAIATGLERKKISLDETLEGDLGLDNIEMLELIFEVEEVFGIKIEEDVERTLITGRDIAKHVHEVKNKLS